MLESYLKKTKTEFFSIQYGFTHLIYVGGIWNHAIRPFLRVKIPSVSSSIYEPLGLCQHASIGHLAGNNSFRVEWWRRFSMKSLNLIKTLVLLLLLSHYTLPKLFPKKLVPLWRFGDILCCHMDWTPFSWVNWSHCFSSFFASFQIINYCRPLIYLFIRLWTKQKY